VILEDVAECGAVSAKRRASKRGPRRPPQRPRPVVPRPSTPPRTPKPWTLGWLANVYFTQGRDAAESALRAIVPAPGLHAVVKTGRATWRTDVEERDGISYENFNPPAFWETPYSILKVKFLPRAKDDFMFHHGEEFLAPLDGAVTYHFFWSGGQAPAGRVQLDGPVQVGSIISIDPQTPHHTWAAGDRPAEAWMIMRDASNRAVSISVDPGVNARGEHSGISRRASAGQLEDPSHYALIAWGLLERIRSHRERARLTIAELAVRCDLDAGHLSRVEAGKANLSLEALVRIARFLQINVANLVPARRDRPWRVDALTGAPGALTPLFGGRGGRPHLMHTHVLELGAGDAHEIAAGWDPLEHSSWITLSGKTLFEFTEGTTRTGELVERGNVIHFRSALPIRIRALDASRLLRFTYSSVCTCGSSATQLHQTP
jgi:transcriptional regulator with XRE-family HTH domain